MKFGMAILLVGLGFYVLVIGAAYAGPDGQVAVVWLVLMYLLHTLGGVVSVAGWIVDGHQVIGATGCCNDDGGLVFIQCLCSLRWRLDREFDGH